MRNTMTLTEMVAVVNIDDSNELENAISDRLEEMYKEDLEDRILKAKENNNLEGLTAEEISELEDDGEIVEGYDNMTQSHYWEWYEEYKPNKIVDDEPLPF
jgi:hypothetical protein